MTEAAEALDEQQMQALRALLQQRRLELMEMLRSNAPRDENAGHGDEVDRAGQQMAAQQWQALQQRAKEQLQEVNEALKRMDEGEYGYCEETGEPIGWQRLQANPTARLGIEAQRRREHQMRMGIHARMH